MYAITGVTGKVGGAVARALLAAGHSVRAVVRNADKGQVWRKRGCKVALATIEDAASRSAAFQGAEAVFVVVPPNFDPSPESLRPEKLETPSTPRWPQRVRSA